MSFYGGSHWNLCAASLLFQSRPEAASQARKCSVALRKIREKWLWNKFERFESLWKDFHSWKDKWKWNHVQAVVGGRRGIKHALLLKRAFEWETELFQ